MWRRESPELSAYLSPTKVSVEKRATLFQTSTGSVSVTVRGGMQPWDALLTSIWCQVWYVTHGWAANCVPPPPGQGNSLKMWRGGGMNNSFSPKANTWTNSAVATWRHIISYFSFCKIKQTVWRVFFLLFSYGSSDCCVSQYSPVGYFTSCSNTFKLINSLSLSVTLSLVIIKC